MLNVNLCGIELENPLMLAAGILGSHASSMNLVLDACEILFMEEQ